MRLASAAAIERRSPRSRRPAWGATSRPSGTWSPAGMSSTRPDLITSLSMPRHAGRSRGTVRAAAGRRGGGRHSPPARTGRRPGPTWQMLGADPSRDTYGWLPCGTTLMLKRSEPGGECRRARSDETGVVDMSVRRPLVDATRATAAGAAEGDLIAVLRRQIRDVRSGTGLEVELQLGPRVPAIRPVRRP